MNVNIHYEHSVVLPFPYVGLAVAKPEENNYEPRPGKIDTGASLTTIPLDLVGSLDLRRVKDVSVYTFDGTKRLYGEYRVNIKIHNALREYVRVIAAQRDNVLVGRDLINLWRMRLDGPSLTGKITLP